MRWLANTLARKCGQIFRFFSSSFAVTFYFIFSIFSRSYEIITAYYFCTRHEKGKNTTSILNCFFLPSILTLWHIRLSSYRKTSLIFTKSINLILSSLEIYRRVIHTKYTTRFFTLSEKKPLSNIQSSNCRKPFLQWVCYCYYLPR